MRKIAIVDDVLPNALLLKGYATRLSDIEVFTFTDPHEALRWCVDNDPDLVMLDYVMPQMDGGEFLVRFRKVEHLRDVPVVVITAEESKDTLYQVLELGANDFLRKPVDDVELLARARNMLKLRSRQLDLAEANERLYLLATTDPLTGLSNRRHFLERLGQEMERSRRYGRNVSLAMIDADRFKRVNDTYGHDVGDEVLRQLARLLTTRVRKGDFAGRLGGEEFGLLLPETAALGGARLCERLLAQVRRASVTVGSDCVHFAVSIGLAEATPALDDASALLKRADLALYRAKTTGRDRLVVFRESDAAEPDATEADDEEPATPTEAVADDAA